MRNCKIIRNEKWEAYWGEAPLPEGAEVFGVVVYDGIGALIRLADGHYVRGNDGNVKALPQAEVIEALLVSEAAAALGRIKSKRKAESSAKNGRLGGRPKKRMESE